MKLKKTIAFFTMILLLLGGITAANAFSGQSSVVFKDKQPGFVPFSYTLKDSYSSRDEVLAELNAFSRAFKNHVEDCSDEYAKSVIPMFDEVRKRLMEELAKYPDPNPPTAEQKFNHKLEFWESEYFMRKVEYEAQTDPYEKELYKDDYIRTKTVYEKYLELKAKLDANEITAEQAYEEGSKLKMYP